MASQMTDSQGGMEHEPSKLLEIWAGVGGVVFITFIAQDTTLSETPQYGS